MASRIILISSNIFVKMLILLLILLSIIFIFAIKLMYKLYIQITNNNYFKF